MVDTILMVAPSASHLPTLDHARDTVNKENGLVSHTGTHRGLRVFQRPDGEVRISGSLATYHNGDNVHTMTRTQVCATVSSLASSCGIDPSECRVYRLDLAATLPLRRPVARYLSVLGSYPRMQRVDYHGETVAFRNTWRYLSFYDKGKQARVDGDLLRFEVQYKKKVKRQLGLALTLADLAHPDRFASLVCTWRSEYSKVTKLQRSILSPTSKMSDLRRQLASAGLASYGNPERLLAVIDSWDLDRRQIHRLRREIRDLAALGNNSDDGALIHELDVAINEAARFALEN